MQQSRTDRGVLGLLIAASVFVGVAIANGFFGSFGEAGYRHLFSSLHSGEPRAEADVAMPGADEQTQETPTDHEARLARWLTERHMFDADHLGVPVDGQRAVIGSPIRSIKLRNSLGSETDILETALNHRATVLIWYNSQCPFTLNYLRSKECLASLRAKYISRGVIFILVDSTNPEFGSYDQDGAIAESICPGVPLLLDTLTGSVGRYFGARTTPHAFALDGAGRLQYQGAVNGPPSAGPFDIDYIDQTLEQLLSDKDVNPQSTKPYGCAVKYAN